MKPTQDFPQEFGGLTDPYQILKLWWDEAHASRLSDPNAMFLATVDPEGRPHGRVVLAKEIRQGSGIVFYTNYQSDKGQEIAGNDNVSVTFFWDPLSKQIRIRGKAKSLSKKESEAYWDSRPRSRQLSQLVSLQSRPVESRELMESALKVAEQNSDGKPIPCPSNWGGYLIHIESIEFWAGHKDRFHDRYRFTKISSGTKVENSWTAQRLYP